MKKKGDASMVAVVLLIVSAIIIGVLVSIFSKQTEEKVEERIKIMGNLVECEDIRLGLIIEGSGIRISNKGTLGIDKVAMRKYAESIAEPEIIGGEDNVWSNYFTSPHDINKLLPNEVTDNYVYDLPGSYNKIEFIPVIITENNKEIGCQNKIVTWEVS